MSHKNLSPKLDEKFKDPWTYGVRGGYATAYIAIPYAVDPATGKWYPVPPGEIRIVSVMRWWDGKKTVDRPLPEVEPPTYDCPQCHERVTDNTSIADHGMCHECHIRWQNGELPWQQEDEENE